MANHEEQFSYFDGATPITGVASELSFRVDPYTSDIAGLTFAETPAGSGNYKCSGFTAYYKDAKLYRNGSHVPSFGTKNIGDPEDNFISMSQTTEQDIFSNIDMNGKIIKNLAAATANGEAVRYEDVIRTSGNQTGIAGTKVVEDIWAYSPSTFAVTSDGQFASKYYVDRAVPFLLGTNELIVDANRSTDITGKAYNTIQEAIDYAQSQSPSATSRWTIYIVPHKNTASYNGYSESLTMYKYIDLIGLGIVMMNCVFTYSGTWTGGTFARLQNLLVRPDVDTNLTVRGVEADNCHFGVEGDSLTPELSLENSQFCKCGLWRFVNTSSDIVTTGNNYIMNCIGNTAITWDAADSVWSYDYIGDTSKYFKLT